MIDDANNRPAHGTGPSSAMRPGPILLLTRDLQMHGGLARVLLTLLRARPSDSGPWHLATLQPPDALAEASFGETGIVPIALGDDGYLGPARRLRGTLRRHGVQLVVCNTFKTLLVARIAAAGLGLRFIYWIHTGSDVLQGPVRPLLARFLAHDAELICVSAYVRDVHDLTRRFGAHVVHNAVEPAPPPPHDRQALRRALGFEVADEVLGYVASFVGFKDHSTLIDAFEQARRERPALRLALFGTGALEPIVRQKVHAAGLSDFVRFLGVRSDLRSVLPALDLYVHPANGEGFGLAAVEAMMAGVPVLVSDAGGLPEFVEEGRTGATARTGSSKIWAERIVELMASPSERARLADGGRRFAENAFSPALFAEQIVGILEGAGGGSKGQGEGRGRAEP